jgi:AcrR family transcriptional regulator
MAQRLSRKESQLQTREQLLDAALEVFSRQGYHAASVDEIAERAGFSKGAVYSNFSSKEDLLLALIDRRFASEVQGYPEIVRLMRDNSQAGDQDTDVKEIWLQDRTWNVLMVEFFLYALRNDAVRKQFAGRLSQLRAAMAKNLETLYQQIGKQPVLPIDEIPWSIFSLGVGMTLQMYIDPDALPDGIYERSLQQLLK